MSDPFESLKISSSNLEAYCSRFCEAIGEPIDYSSECPGMDPRALESPSSGPRVFLWRKVEVEARGILTDCFRYLDPSPYKVCAATTLAMLKEAPIPRSIPEAMQGGNLGDTYQFRHSLCAWVALNYCFRRLHRARVGDRDFLLERPVVLSRHFLMDFVATLVAEANRIEEASGKYHFQAPFGHLSLLYEACSYIENRDAQNGDRIEFPR